MLNYLGNNAGGWTTRLISSGVADCQWRGGIGVQNGREPAAVPGRMRWGELGSDDVAHLRAMYRSDPDLWDDFWAPAGCPSTHVCDAYPVHYRGSDFPGPDLLSGSDGRQRRQPRPKNCPGRMGDTKVAKPANGVEGLQAHPPLRDHQILNLSQETSRGSTRSRHRAVGTGRCANAKVADWVADFPADHEDRSLPGRADGNDRIHRLGAGAELEEYDPARGTARTMADT